MKEAIIQYNDDPDADGNHMVISWKRLVRCKNCAYSLFKEGMQPGHIVCTKPFTEQWQATKPNDWYCADGLVE